MPATAEAAQHLTPTATDTVTTAASDFKDAEIIMLRGKYFTFFAHTLLIFSLFFLAQLAAMTNKVQAAQEVAAESPNTEDVLVERPRRGGGLQAAMLLQDDPGTYSAFCVSQFSFLLSVLVLELNIYYRLTLHYLQLLQISTLN
jgi:hypothetical protein